MSKEASQVERMKKLVQKIKAKRKKAKTTQSKRANSGDKKTSAERHKKKQQTTPRKKKDKTVFQGPFGGQYIVLPGGKKKYGITKSNKIQEFVKTMKRSK